MIGGDAYRKGDQPVAVELVRGHRIAGSGSEPLRRVIVVEPRHEEVA